MLDTRADPNFIRKDILPSRVLAQVQEVQLSRTRGANSNSVRTVGLVALVVRNGCPVVNVDFIVCERLAASLILGCDFSDRFVQTIYPRKKEMKFNDGTMAPICRKPKA